MKGTYYRVYADGWVVHEDDFEEYDNSQPYYDDYKTVEVPDFIAESYNQDNADFAEAAILNAQMEDYHASI